jgi:hypothetical protein
MVAIQTENGDFSIFENINDEEFERGDEVSWENNTGMGPEKLTNHTRHFSGEVFFENHEVSLGNLSL